MRDDQQPIKMLNERTYKSRGLSPEYSKNALASARERDDDLEIAESSIYLGVCYGLRGETELTLSLLNQAHTLLRKLSKVPQDLSLESLMHAGFGIAYDNLGQCELSLEHHQKSYDLADLAGNSYAQQRALLNISHEYVKLGQFRDAIHYITQTLDHQEKNLYIFAFTQELLGDLFIEQQNYDLSRQHYATSLASFYKADNADLIALSRLNTKLSKAFLGTHQLDEAERHIKNAQELCQQKDILQWGQILETLARIYYTQAQFTLALNKSDEALKIFTELDAARWVVDVLILKADILRSMGEVAASFKLIMLIKSYLLSDSQKRAIMIVEMESFATIEDWKNACNLQQKIRELTNENHHKSYLTLPILYELKTKMYENQIAAAENRQLVIKNATLQDLYHEKKEVLEIVNHDLNNPITVLKLSIGSIIKQKGKYSSGKLRQQLQRCTTALKRMQGLISQIQTLQTIESNKMEHLELVYQPLLPLINAELEMCKIYASRKEQTIRLQTAEGAIYAAINEEGFRQIIDNLVSNAIKYSPKKSKIIVDVTRLSRKIRISVIDEGQGFDQAEAPKLFRKYSRLSAVPTGDESSTGLGLYIVDTLIKAMNGQVAATSNGLSKGSTFFVDLPQP